MSIPGNGTRLVFSKCLANFLQSFVNVAELTVRTQKMSYDNLMIILKIDAS